MLNFCLSKHIIFQEKRERRRCCTSYLLHQARPLIPRFNNRRPRLSSSQASPNQSLDPDLLGPAICASCCVTIRAWVHVDFNSRLPTFALFGQLLGVDQDLGAGADPLTQCQMNLYCFPLPGRRMKGDTRCQIDSTADAEVAAPSGSAACPASKPGLAVM